MSQYEGATHERPPTPVGIRIEEDSVLCSLVARISARHIAFVLWYPGTPCLFTGVGTRGSPYGFQML